MQVARFKVEGPEGQNAERLAGSFEEFRRTRNRAVSATDDQHFGR